MKIILINGAPESGKDVIADEIVCQLKQTTHHKPIKVMMKTKLFDAAIKTSGVPVKEWERHYERDLKEVPWDKLVVNGNPVSPRQYLIHISETVMKPLFGDRVFGLAAKNHLISLNDKGYDMFVFSDSGFESEVMPLLDICDDILLVHLHREGKTFAGDSRSFIYPNSDKITTAKVVNDGTIEEAAREIIECLE